MKEAKQVVQVLPCALPTPMLNINPHSLEAKDAAVLRCYIKKLFWKTAQENTCIVVFFNNSKAVNYRYKPSILNVCGSSEYAQEY